MLSYLALSGVERSRKVTTGLLPEIDRRVLGHLAIAVGTASNVEAA